MQMISRMSGIAFRVYLISKKGNVMWCNQKVGENKMRMMVHAKLYLMGCQDGGHMTDFQKWQKNNF